MSIEKVYEAVDSTSEEQYWTLGIWLSLEEALAAIAECKDPSDLGGDRDECDEFCKVEIRERKIGWSGTGKTIAVIEWVSQYDEQYDEFIWSVKTRG